MRMAGSSLFWGGGEEVGYCQIQTLDSTDGNAKNYGKQWNVTGRGKVKKFKIKQNPSIN
jgi:hypothetical protein